MVTTLAQVLGAQPVPVADTPPPPERDAVRVRLAEGYPLHRGGREYVAGDALVVDLDTAPR